MIQGQHGWAVLLQGLARGCGQAASQAVVSEESASELTHMVKALVP